MNYMSTTLQNYFKKVMNHYKKVIDYVVFLNTDMRESVY